MCIGIYLFVKKYYTDLEEYTAFYVMIGLFVIYAIYDISFWLYKMIAGKYMKDWVMPIEKTGELEHLQADSGEKKTGSPPKKLPSPVS